MYEHRKLRHVTDYDLRTRFKKIFLVRRVLRHPEHDQDGPVGAPHLRPRQRDQRPQLPGAYPTKSYKYLVTRICNYKYL
jgi:hypothetical protein